MNIIDSEFTLFVNMALFQKTQMNADSFMEIARIALTEMPAHYWPLNQQIIREGAVKTKGLDCYKMPIADTDGRNYVVEFTPTVAGVVVAMVQNEPETVPDPRKEDTLAITRDMILRCDLKESRIFSEARDGNQRMGESL